MHLDEALFEPRSIACPASLPEGEQRRGLVQPPCGGGSMLELVARGCEMRAVRRSDVSKRPGEEAELRARMEMEGL